MNGPPCREFMLWGICMIVPSRGFWSSMRNPRKNTLSCWTIVKHLSLTPLSKRFFLPVVVRMKLLFRAYARNLIELSLWDRDSSFCIRYVQNDVRFAGNFSGFTLLRMIRLSSRTHVRDFMPYAHWVGDSSRYYVSFKMTEGFWGHLYVCHFERGR